MYESLMLNVTRNDLLDFCVIINYINYYKIKLSLCLKF